MSLKMTYGFLILYSLFLFLVWWMIRDDNENATEIECVRNTVGSCGTGFIMGIILIITLLRGIKTCARRRYTGATKYFFKLHLNVLYFISAIKIHKVDDIKQAHLLLFGNSLDLIFGVIGLSSLI